MKLAIPMTVLATVSAAATADVSNVISFAFSDLNGSLSGTSFTAVADTDTNGQMTGGDVSRIDTNAGTADFSSGFSSDSAEADVQISLSVDNLVSGLADGSGSFSITDDDGDVFSGDLVNGLWRVRGSFVIFDADVANVSFEDNGDQDGTFDGSAGSFTISDLVSLTLDGALSLLFRQTGGLTQDFSGTSTQADGLLLPNPGTLVLAGAGGLLVGLRRRR